MNPLTLDSRSSIAEAFFTTAEANPGGIVFEQAVQEANNPDDVRTWRKSTFAEVRGRVLSLANFLRSKGVSRGVRVAIISNSRPEWMEADLAVQSLGGVSVSIYQSVTTQDVGYILYDSEAQYVVVENQEQLEKLKTLLTGPIEIPATENRNATRAQIGLRQIVTIERCDPHPLATWLQEIPQLVDVPVPTEINGITREELAALVYTSGTTGPPKGVMQTHGNHLSNVRQAFQSGLFTAEYSIMLFLPLAHAFGKLMGYIGFLTDTVVKFPAIADQRSSKANPESIGRDIRESNCEVVPIVPRLLEKMEGGIKAKAMSGGLGGFLLSKAIGENRDSLGFKLTGFIRRKVKRKLFGAKFKYAVSGGAKLGVDTAKFFDRIGILVLQGYGLTETVVATNVNRPNSNRIGTVGPILGEGIQVQIAPDGEICFRGPNVAKGYLNRPEATAAAWDSEGWFHTGDLGSLSDDGFLSITGRKKELIVTSNGKKIAPEIIEQKIKAGCPLMSQFLMYGEARSYNVALVTINFEAAKPWAAKAGITISRPSESEPLRTAILEHVENVNKTLSNFEAVHKIVILDEDFSIENGLLTPTFKAKRNAVYKRYAEAIENLYRE
jgi:long-chain acyl-CoA synthetase